VAWLRDNKPQPHIPVRSLDLTDEETEALVKELRDIVVRAKYPFSPRIQTLRAILGKPLPEPPR
jgi:hypothetical protein